MKSKGLARPISVSRIQQGFSQTHHLKAYGLFLVLALLALIRQLLSYLPNFSSTNRDTSPDEILSDFHNGSLDSPGNVSPKLTNAMFFGAPELIDLPFFDSGSMTAIIPVTDKSLDKFFPIVEEIVSEESSISAVTIVCPLEVIPALRQKLLTVTVDIAVDMHVTIWPEELDEGPAILNAASQAPTEYALVVASTGFEDLSEDAREHLLSHPLLLDVPYGFCGGNFSDVEGQAICFVPSSEARPVSFLLPPFVIPTSLTHGFNWTSLNGKEFWMNLGKALLHVNEAGAIVRESQSRSDKAWCQTLCRKASSILDDPSLAQCSSPLDLRSAERSSDLSQSSSLAIILQTVEDLETLSSVACKFSRSGYNTHVLILSHESDRAGSHDNSFPWLHDHLISSVCNISYSALHGSVNTFANAEAVTFWLESANETMSVIIYGSGISNDTSEHPFEAALDKQKALGVTVIKIPPEDIPFCDWIGSLSLEELRYWHVPDIEISVITDNRPSSLKRLFSSLTNALYFGDSVPLRINVEQTADIETRRLVDSFTWKHGHVFVHHRVVHAGLLTAIVESWYPRSNHTYGTLLEDDTEVSPLFYAWIKMSLLRYRYGSPSNKRESLYGISLYQQKQIELRPEGRRPFDAQSLFDMYGVLYRNTPYLSQIPCSWGAVYFPEQWREFHTYLMVRFSEAWLPLHDLVVPHVRSNRWAKSWKRFFIELAFLRGYVMLYPNYDNFVSLSTNHLEVGSHVKEQPRSIYEQKKALFTLPLMTLSEDASESGKSRETGLLDLPEGQLPPWSDLPILDLLGTLASEEEIEDRGKQRQNKLVECTTVGSLAERRHPFEAEELFTCFGGLEEENEPDYDVDSGEDAL